MREVSVRKVDQFIKTLAKIRSYSMAKQARTVLSLAFGLAVRYDAKRENPVRSATPLASASRPPRRCRSPWSRSRRSVGRCAAGAVETVGEVDEQAPEALGGGIGRFVHSSSPSAWTRPPPADPAQGHGKRLSSARLRSSGWSPTFPSFREATCAPDGPARRPASGRGPRARPTAHRPGRARATADVPAGSDWG